MHGLETREKRHTATGATPDLNPGASPEKWEKNINKAVETMFKHYP